MHRVTLYLLILAAIWGCRSHDQTAADGTKVMSEKYDFSKNFNPSSFASRISADRKITMKLVADVSSLEIFFDDGLSVMTSLYFPDRPVSKMRIRASGAMKVEDFVVRELEGIW